MADGNIDNLNFGVILSDTEFDQQIESVKTKAEQFNTEVSKLLEFQVKISSTEIIKAEGVSNAKELAGYVNDIVDKLNSVDGKNLLIGDANALNETLQKILSSIDELNKKTEETKGKVKNINGELEKSHNLMSTISKLTGLTFGAAGIKSFISSLVRITGEFEVQKMALRSMIQDAGKADEIFNTLRQRALESPYTFQDLTKYAKQLTAFNIGADQLVETERRLADVAAGLGVDMGRIILAYGQVKAAGVLKGTELRQFTEAGVPLLQTLAEQIKEAEGHTIGLAEVFQRITKKEIPFEMVEEAFRRMTSEGGKFYKMQEVLVETLQGKIGKLRDVWQQAMYDIGNSQDSVLKGAVDSLTFVVKHLSDIGKILKPVVAGFGAYYTALGVAAARQKILNLAKFVKDFTNIAKATNIATAAVQKFGTAAKASAVGLGVLFAAAAAVIGIISRFTAAARSVEEFNKQLKAVHEEAMRDHSLDVEKEKIEILLKTIRNSNLAYDERKRALDQLKGIVPDYLAFLTKEGELINDNKEAIERYIEAKERSMRAKALDAELEQLLELQKQAQKAVDETKKTVDETLNMQQNAFSSPYTRGFGLMFNSGELDAAETKLKNVGEAIDGVKQQMAALLAEGAKADDGDNEPKWEPMKAINEIEKMILDPNKILEQVEDEVDRELLQMMNENTDAIIKDLDERIKAMNDFDKFLEDWALEGLKTGEGVERKLSGFFVDYKKSDKEAGEEYKRQLKNLQKQFDESSVSFINGKKKLDDWLESVREANRYDFQEKVVGLADELFKEGLKGFDLTDWNDKTLAQIQAIREAIMSLDVPDTLKQFLDKATLAALEQALKETGQATIDNTVDPEQFKKIAKYAKQIAKYISQAGDAMIRLGNATDNANLSDAGKAISAIGQNLNAAAEGYEKTGHWIGAVVGGVIDIFNQVTNAISESNEEMKKLEDTIRNIRKQADSDAFKKFMSSGTNGVFGDNFVRMVSNAVKALDGFGDKLKEIDKLWNEYHSWYFMNGPIQQSWFLSSGVEGTKIRTKESFWGDTWKTLQEIADEFGLEMRDEFNNLNPVLLQKILDTYGQLNDKAKDWLTTAIEYSEQYAEAMKQIEDATKDIFDSVAEDMADTFIENFLRIGNAVDDLSGVFTALGETILKSFLQSYVLDNILTKYEQDAKDALTKYSQKQMTPEEYAAWLSEFAENVKRDSEELAPAINSMIDAFKDRGLLGVDKDTADSLGSGIQSITEDTANLLASYINAMRADLSYMRVLQETGWRDVARIAEMVTSPTLNDYLAQVAANTFDTSQKTQQILNELQSVIGAPGTTGAVVRVERYS